MLPATHENPEIEVQGVRAEGNGILPRKEIDDFIKDPIQLNLFLIAYHELMSNDKAAGGYALSDMQSFFQIAGIHHIPCTVWNGVEGNCLSAALKQSGVSNEWNSGSKQLEGQGKPEWQPADTGDIKWFGYCTHGTVLFPSWHRCYMVLWEQIVHRKICEIEERFAYRSAASKLAAKTFRLPFVDPLRPRTRDLTAAADWASRPSGTASVWNRSGFTYGLPAIMTKKRVRVSMPNANGLAEQWEIDNPLHSYKIPGLAALSDPRNGINKFTPRGLSNERSTVSERFSADISSGLKQSERTARCPNPATGWSSHQTLNDNMGTVADAFRLKLYNILTKDQSYLHMASTTSPSRIGAISRPEQPAIPPSRTALEAFHNDLHVMFGGSAFTATSTQAGGTTLAPTGRGQMTEPKTAAVDPVFFLHHSNIERLLCLWQQAWPGRWWRAKMPDGSDAQVGLPYPDADPPGFALDPFRDGLYYEHTDTMYTAPYTWEKTTTPLIPFRRPFQPGVTKARQKRWWNTNDIEDYENIFGYSYVGLEKGRKETDEARDNAIAYINKWFGWAHGSVIAELRDQAVSSQLQPVDYGDNWQTDFRAFADDPRLAIDDTPLVSAAPTPLAPKSLPIRMAMRGARSAHAEVTMSEKVAGPPVKMATAAASGSIAAPTDQSQSDHLDDSKSQRAVVQNHIDSWTPHPTSLQSGKLRNWNFNFTVDRNALRGTFQIYVFIGDFPPEVNEWASEPHLVMSSGIFTTGVPLASEINESTDLCPNCVAQDARQQDYSDFVPLTKMLMDYFRSGERQPPGAEGLVLRSLEPEDVVPFLKRNLHWRVVSAKAGPVDREQTSGLKASVTSQLMKLPTKLTEMPIYEDEELHAEITDGRPSGVGFLDASGDVVSRL